MSQNLLRSMKLGKGGVHLDIYLVHGYLYADFVDCSGNNIRLRICEFLCLLDSIHYTKTVAVCLRGRKLCINPRKNGKLEIEIQAEHQMVQQNITLSLLDKKCLLASLEQVRVLINDLADLHMPHYEVRNFSTVACVTDAIEPHIIGFAWRSSSDDARMTVIKEKPVAEVWTNMARQTPIRDITLFENEVGRATLIVFEVDGYVFVALRRQTHGNYATQVSVYFRLCEFIWILSRINSAVARTLRIGQRTISMMPKLNAIKLSVSNGRLRPIYSQITLTPQEFKQLRLLAMNGLEGEMIATLKLHMFNYTICLPSCNDYIVNS
jgi:hypothetical protein